MNNVDLIIVFCRILVMIKNLTTQIRKLFNLSFNPNVENIFYVLERPIISYFDILVLSFRFAGLDLFEIIIC